MKKKGSPPEWDGDKEGALVFHLAQVRAETGLNQAQFSKLVGVSQHQLAQQERARQLSTEAKVLCLGLVAGLELEDLLAPHVLDALASKAYELREQLSVYRQPSPENSQRKKPMRRARATDWCQVVCMREQILTQALVSSKQVRFVRRCRLRPHTKIATILVRWRRDFSSYPLVVEEGKVLDTFATTVGWRVLRLNLETAKRELIPDSLALTHRNLYLAVLNVFPKLRSIVTVRGALRLTQPWRTMPLLTAGLGFTYHKLLK